MKKTSSFLLAILFVVVLFTCSDRSFARGNQSEENSVERLLSFCMNAPNDFKFEVNLTQNGKRDYERLLVQGDAVQFFLSFNEPDVYAYLFYIDAKNNVARLFSEKATERLTTDDAGLFPDRPILLSKPFGEEQAVAIATTEKLKSLENMKSGDGITRIDEATLKALVEEVQALSASQDVKLATSVLAITTFENAQARKSYMPKRILVAIGIDVYADPSFKRLLSCVEDVDDLEQLFVEKQKVVASQYSFVLRNQEASLENIRVLLSRKLPCVARDGDQVIVYWSSHGIRAAAPLNADRNAKKNAARKPLRFYFATYDCEQLDPTSMASDDDLSDWLNRSFFCKKLLIVDACHSGQAIDAKDGWNEFLEKKAAKSINGPNLGVLVSSEAEEVSLLHEQRNSLMTRFLLDELRSQRNYSAKDLYNAIFPKVEIEAKRRNTTQTVIFASKYDDNTFIVNPNDQARVRKDSKRSQRQREYTR